MKKLLLFAVASTVLLTGCSITMSQTNIVKIKESKPIKVTNVMADLEVSPNKVTYMYLPSKSVNKAGYKNVIETAVREALIENGNADVMVHLDKQLKLDAKGKIISIVISGYPAKYVKFRSLDEKYILELARMYETLNLKLSGKAVDVKVPNMIPNIMPKDIAEGAEESYFPVSKRRKKRAARR